LRICLGKSIVSCVGGGVDICAMAMYESHERGHFRPVELVKRRPGTVSRRSDTGIWICGDKSDGHIDVLYPSGQQAAAAAERA
jgi:hypothetical protein